MKRKIFIPNSTSHNYSNAKRFGTLIRLTSGNLDLTNASRMFRLMSEQLHQASPDDYILISGASVPNSVACGIFASKFNCLNLLIYRRDGKYVERNLVF